MFSQRLLGRLILTLAVLHAQLLANNLSGTVTSGGLPLVGAEVEVAGSAVTATTDAFGNFTLVLPAGTYHLQVIPPTGLGLAPTVVANVSLLTATASVGTIQVSTGVTVSGVVQTTTGAPVVLGDIDIFDDETGFKLGIEDDATDLSGAFAIQIPARTLRVRAEPTPGLLLVAQATTTVFTSNTSLGVIQLPPGVLLSGTVVAAVTSLPLAGVDIDVDDMFTGQRIETPTDNTDALGAFSLIVPTGTYQITYEPAPNAFFVARRDLDVVVTSAMSVGTIALDAGIRISGTVFGPGGVPIAGADIDVRRQAGDEIQLTLNDTTGPNGAFAVVVRPGTHRVIIEPPFATQLIAVSTPFQSFGVTTTLPAFNLQTGHVLSGQVNFGPAPEAACAIVVRHAAGAALVETANNRTNAAGQYQVVVPTGVFDVSFVTRKGSLARDATTNGVSVTGPTTLNATLTQVDNFVFLIDPAVPDPQIVPAGFPLLVTAVIYNPNFFTTGVLLDAVIEGPFGAVIPLAIGAPVVLGGQGYILGLYFPIPLPPLNAAHAGLPHQFRLRVRDVSTGSEIDTDSFTFLPF